MIRSREGRLTAGWRDRLAEGTLAATARLSPLRVGRGILLGAVSAPRVSGLPDSSVGGVQTIEFARGFASRLRSLPWPRKPTTSAKCYRAS